MINNSILRADAQVCNNLDVRVKHEYDRKRKMREHNNTIEQSGRSMIEMLGVLAIVGVLSVGGIAGYSKAMEKFKINKHIEQISHIVANIRTLYAQQTTYSGLNNQNAIKMGIIPDGLKTSNSYITNDFGGYMIIASNYYDPQTFGVSTQLTPEICTILASYDWGDKNSSGLIGMQIMSGYGGVLGEHIYASFEYDNCSLTDCNTTNVPISLSSATEVCNYYETIQPGTYMTVSLIYQ